MSETTADQVHTGMVITTPHAWPQMLEVAYPLHDRFTNPEGATINRTRFTGWIVTGGQGIYTRHQWVEDGFGVPSDGRVDVIDDLREGGPLNNIGYRFGEL